MTAKRFATRELASVEVYGRKSDTRFATVKDLSETGACLEWKETVANLIDIGDLVRVTVHLKTIGRRRSVSAQVIWSNGQKSGLQFLNEQELLNRMLTRDLPTPRTG